MQLIVGMFMSVPKTQRGHEPSPGDSIPLDGLKHAVEPGAHETLCEKAGHTPAGAMKGGVLRQRAESFPPTSGACGWCVAEQEER